jgi:hypothetical protein
MYCGQHLVLPYRVRPDESMRSRGGEGGSFVTTCPQCQGTIEKTEEELRVWGSPRNVPVSLHYDGFQAARTTQRNAAIMDVFPVCATARDRSHKLKQLLWVIQYPPKEDMGTGPEFLDFTMLPAVFDFMRLEDEGIVVRYALGSEEIMSGLPPKAAGSKVRVRTALFLTTGDQPALAEILKRKRSGYHGSRKYKKGGVLVGRRVVYKGARRDARGCTMWTLEEVLAAANEQLEAGPGTPESAEIAERTGVTGFPFIHLLEPFSFNPLKDGPSCFFHTSPGNQVKNTKIALVIPEKKPSPNKGLPKEERDPKAGSTVTVAEVAKTFNRIRFTRKLSAGRCPRNPLEKSWAFLKGEDHQKLAEVCFESMFAPLLDLRQFVIATLTARITQMVFRTPAWSAEDRLKLENLCKARAIHAEELWGPQGKPLEHEIACHSGEDIRRFGPPRGFWTASQEREVKNLVRMPNNGKQLEAAYVRREYSKLVSRHMATLIEERNMRAAGKGYGDLAWERALKWFSERGCVIVNSQVKAKEVWESMELLERTVCGDLKKAAFLGAVALNGLVVGIHPSRWRRRNRSRLDVSQWQGARNLVATLEGGGSRARAQRGGVVMRSVTVDGANFAKGDFVVLKGPQWPGDEQYGQLRGVYIVQDKDGGFHALLDCSYFPVKVDDGNRMRGAPRHNMVLLGALKANKQSTRMRRATDLLRHFIPYPEEASKPCKLFHAIETDRLTQAFRASDVFVPVYPMVSVWNIWIYASTKSLERVEGLYLTLNRAELLFSWNFATLCYPQKLL